MFFIVKNHWEPYFTDDLRTYTTSGDPLPTFSKELKFKKSSGYDPITANILEELPITGIKYLTQLFSDVLLKEQTSYV
jgi:hypothetical protein